MACDLVALCVAALDPDRADRFWTALLGRPVSDPAETGFALRFVPTSTTKTTQNPMHLDLTSASPADQRATVATALRLGARHVDVGQRDDESHVVLGDVEGNEFCVIAAGNAFLAGCGFLGAIACDGSRDVGHFWAAALGWPLVWDQDEETAIRSPRGGPKISWGGPPLMPRTDPDRLYFEVTPAPAADLRSEVERLLALGATRRTGESATRGAVDLSDPDGNLFRVLTFRATGQPGPGNSRRNTN